MIISYLSTSLKRLLMKSGSKVLFIRYSQVLVKVAVAIEDCANGYLAKGSDDELLPEALQTILAGKIYLCPLAEKAFTKVNIERKRQEAKLKLYGLTNCEFEVALLYGKL